MEYLQCHHLAPCSAKCRNENCSGYGVREAYFCEKTATRNQQQAGIDPGFVFRCSICHGNQSAMGLYYKYYQDYERAMHMTYMLMYDYPIFIVRHELGLRRGENINKELEFLGDVATEALTDHFTSQRRTWKRMQVDEVCFGKKKDGRGNHGRTDSEGKGALEWYMSVTENDETGRTTDFFMEPCPNNRRTAAEVTWHVERLAAEGSSVSTDGWGGYACIGHGVRPDVTHKVVVHKHEFKAKDGTHTNNVENAHGVFKRKQRAQFGRQLGSVHAHVHACPCYMHPRTPMPMHACMHRNGSRKHQHALKDLRVFKQNCVMKGVDPFPALFSFMRRCRALPL